MSDINEYDPKDVLQTAAERAGELAWQRQEAEIQNRRSSVTQSVIDTLSYSTVLSTPDSSPVCDSSSSSSDCSF